jgi:hypothetical protein
MLLTLGQRLHQLHMMMWTGLKHTPGLKHNIIYVVPYSDMCLILCHTISIIHTYSMWRTLSDLAKTSSSYDDVVEMPANETIAHTVMGMSPDTNTVCIWRDAMKPVVPEVALQAVAVVEKVADASGRVVWKEEQKKSDGGWTKGLFNTGSLFAKGKSCKWYSYELDKVLIQGNTMTSGWHTDLTRRLVTIYPGATKGWARVWLFVPPIGLGKPAKGTARVVSRPTIRKLRAWFADVDKKALAHEGLQNFFRAAKGKEQDLVRVVITYPGDVMYIPIGRMHNVLTIQVPTATAYSKLCVSGGLGIAHQDDLVRMRYVSQNNIRLGRSKIKISQELTRLASLLGSHVPASVSPRGKGQRVSTARMQKINGSKEENAKIDRQKDEKKLLKRGTNRKTNKTSKGTKNGDKQLVSARGKIQKKKKSKKTKQQSDRQPKETTESKRTKRKRCSNKTSCRKKLKKLN